MAGQQAAGREAAAAQGETSEGGDTSANPAFGGAASAAERDGGASASTSGAAGAAGAVEEWCEGGELVAMADLKFSRVIGEVWNPYGSLLHELPRIRKAVLGCGRRAAGAFPAAWCPQGRPQRPSELVSEEKQSLAAGLELHHHRSFPCMETAALWSLVLVFP